MRRRRRTLVRRHVILLVLALVVSGQALGWAAWRSTSSTAGIRQVRAGTLAAPAAPSAIQVVGGRTVGLAWAPVPIATSYEVRHHTMATGGTPTIACTATQPTCVDPTARSGSAHWYSVAARVGSAWVSESPRVHYASDDVTTVAIVSLGGDSGSSSSDFVTRNAATTLTGTAEAGDTIAVRRDGSTIATATATGTGQWTSTAFTLAEGVQSLTAVAGDAYGNTATDTRAGVRLDTVAPVTGRTATCSNVGNTAPSGSWCKVTSLTMTATFGDADSGLVTGTGQYENNGGGWTAYTGPLSLAEANGRVVQLRATDVAGNVGSSSATYYIDGTPPDLVVSAPTSGLSVSLALLGQLLSSTCGGRTACGTSSDAVSGLPSVTAVKWQLKKGSQCLVHPAGTYGACAMQDATGTLPAWSTPSSGGFSILSSYTFTAQSTDAAGNARTVAVDFGTLL